MRRFLRSRVSLAVALLADVLLYSSEHGPYDYTASSFEVALAAQERFTEDWLALDGVVGTAIGVDGAGHAVLKVYVTAARIAMLPTFVGVDVVQEVTGPFLALPADDAEAAD